MSDEAAAPETAPKTAPENIISPETRPEAATALASQPAAAPGGTTRPEFLKEKFWDAEKAQPKVEDLARSYNEMERLIGSRVGDLGVEARRKLAESLPEALQATWAEEFKAKLKDDPAFLDPIKEAWLAEHRDARHAAAGPTHGVGS